MATLPVSSQTTLLPLASASSSPSPSSASSPTRTQPRLKAILKYRGSKWRLAPWIVSHFPAPESYTTYVEPFFGSGAVFFTKPPSKHEILNDLSGDVVNLFRVLREHGRALAALVAMTPWARAEYEASYTPICSGCEEQLETARRFLVRCWQAQHLDFTRQTGWRHNGATAHSPTTALWSKLPARLLAAVERLKQAEIECRPALELIQRHSRPEVLLYVDPPYVLATRRRKRLYAHEMNDADHMELLETLDAHPGPVVLSGYPNPLYDGRLARWQRFETAAVAEGGGPRTEVLWVKPATQQPAG